MTGLFVTGTQGVDIRLNDRHMTQSSNRDCRVSRRRVVRSFAAGIAVCLGSSAGIRSVPARASNATPEPVQEGSEMEFVLAPDGTHIAYQRSGDGPPLVLVHGTADDHRRWLPLLPALGEHFTVYALDRRGRGDSDPYDPSSYDIELEFADVAAVVDATGEPAYLLGHSFGALCALEAALLTSNVRKLVLYEPPILIPTGPSFIPPEAVTQLDQLLAAGDKEGVLLAFARNIVGVPEEMIDQWRAMPEWQASVEMAPTIVSEVHGVAGYVFDPTRFRDLGTPTLLLMGSESSPFFATATEAVAVALPHDQVEILPGQSHIAMDTDPALFLEKVLEFLIEK